MIKSFTIFYRFFKIWAGGLTSYGGKTSISKIRVMEDSPPTEERPPFKPSSEGRSNLPTELRSPGGLR